MEKKLSILFDFEYQQRARDGDGGKKERKVEQNMWADEEVQKW